MTTADLQLSSSQWAEILEVYAQLFELPVAERVQALAAWHFTDEQLRPEVARLLHNAKAMRSQSFMTGQARDLINNAGWNDTERKAGFLFGKYRLKRLLGVGGMGEVWLADRADGHYLGQVALKILHSHLNQQGIRERFSREGSFLARLSHANIAHLLDAGISDQGELYLVLEYVAGERLDDWCDARDLSLNARLQLILQVCDAIAYAHTQLIVHRDLKPSNILVTAHNDIKLLDFGIAKLVEADKQHLDLDELAQALTPQYAAPEQINGQEVSTSCDVYTLGVLIYRLLTGSMPYGKPDLTALGWKQEVLHTTPLLMSEQLLQTPEAQTIAAARSCPAKQLAKQLSGDLDAIAAKALAKTPEDRYLTVTALADDIRRYLGFFPIKARPLTARLQIGKFVRRNRWMVSSAFMVVLSLSAGITGLIWQTEAAQQAARQAELQRSKAENVKNFLISVFAELDPLNRQLPEQRTAQQLVQRAVSRLDEELKTEPELKAELLGELGEIQFNLGDFSAGLFALQQALEQQELLFGKQSMEVVRTLYRLAAAEFANDHRDIAEQRLHQALDILSSSGQQHSLESAQVKARLAYFMAGRQGVQPEALQLIESAVQDAEAQLGNTATKTTDILSLYGNLLWRGRYTEQAQTVLIEAIRRYEQELGPSAIRLWQPLSDLGVLYSSAGQFDLAMQQLQRAMDILTPHVPPKNRQIAALLIQQGNVQQRMLQFDKAELSYQRAQQAIPEGAEDVQRNLYGELAIMYMQTGDDVQSERYAQLLYELRLQSLGENNFSVHVAAAEWGRTLSRLKRYGKAEQLQRQALAKITALEGPDAYHNGPVLDALAQTLADQQLYLEAAELQRRALRLTEQRYNSNHKVWAERSWLLVSSLAALTTESAVAEARPLLAQSIKVLSALNPQDERLPYMHEVAALLRSGKAADAFKISDQPDTSN